MKFTGIVRKLDDLGRIVLPSELRKIMDINSGDAVEIFTDGPKIILKKYQPVCIFCGTTENTVYFKEKLVCEDCIASLSK